MNFKEMYDAIPGMTEDGKAKIYAALDRLGAMGESGTEADKEEAGKVMQSGVARLENIDKMARRLQTQVHALALMCMDTSIPADPAEETGVIQQG